MCTVRYTVRMYIVPHGPCQQSVPSSQRTSNNTPTMQSVVALWVFVPRRWPSHATLHHVSTPYLILRAEPLGAGLARTCASTSAGRQAGRAPTEGGVASLPGEVRCCVAAGFCSRIEGDVLSFQCESWRPAACGSARPLPWVLALLLLVDEESVRSACRYQAFPSDASLKGHAAGHIRKRRQDKAMRGRAMYSKQNTKQKDTRRLSPNSQTKLETHLLRRCRNGLTAGEPWPARNSRLRPRPSKPPNLMHAPPVALCPKT